MYTGNNPTAIESMEALADALMDMLETVPLSSVSIKDLCKRADRSRQTYYCLFDSKQEILEWHFGRLFAEYLASLPVDPTFETMSREFFNYWYRYPFFVSVMVRNHMIGFLVREMEKCLVQIAPFYQAAIKTSHAEYVTSGVAGLLANMLVKWFHEGFDTEPQVMAQIAGELVGGRLFGAGACI